MKRSASFYLRFLFILPGMLLFATAIAQRSNARDNHKLPAETRDSFGMKDHFDRQYGAAAMKYAFDGKSAKDVEAWKKAFLPKLRSALGLDKIGRQLTGYEPKAEKKDSVDLGFCIREHWIIWTEPSVPLPVVILFPKNKPGKLPLTLTPHGHGRNADLYDGIYPRVAGKEPTEKANRSIAAQSVSEGYITIAPTVRAFGATRSEYDKKEGNSFSCRDQLMKDLLVGRTPIGDRVWDISKIIDWAVKNLPVDENRIAITGNSGGGTVSLFAAACDPRIAVAAPGSAFCTFYGSIGTIAHCDCNYIPGIADLGEMGDVAGLICPRAFCALNGVEDHIFPIAETRKAFAHLQKIYAAAGASSKAELYEGPAGHWYYKEGAWPFIKKHFSSIK
ncbi:MAG TPA: CocE/NonD family hydrolase [Flavitalea sp.]|nr:CocE/NonD family hydrolase [Flavitalea sp.]